MERTLRMLEARIARLRNSSESDADDPGRPGNGAATG